MSVMPVFTQYNVNPHTLVCTNPRCPRGQAHAHYQGIGQVVNVKCTTCGKRLTRIQGEQYGTKHAR